MEKTENKTYTIRITNRTGDQVTNTQNSEEAEQLLLGASNMGKWVYKEKDWLKTPEMIKDAIERGPATFFAVDPIAGGGR